MELVPSIFGQRYALAPELVLTPSGVRRGHILAVENGTIAAVAERDRFAAEHSDWPLTRLPDRAIVPGFIDAHTHLGQTFGKSAIAGEPTQIWKRVWVPLENALDAERSYVAAAWMM